MAFKLPPLPWAENALEPYTSAKTIQFHYGKHHSAYVDKLNKAVEGTDMKGMTLEQVIIEGHKASNNPVFNNGAQAWNHTFFWNCMKPNGGNKPDQKLTVNAQIVKDFGSFDTFAQKFKEAAANQFGSGWAWLVLEKDQLKVLSTKDADNPIIRGQTPLLTIDVWEHAYYLDYQNRRPDFIGAFVDHLVNWDYVEENYKKAHGSKL